MNNNQYRLYDQMARMFAQAIEDQKIDSADVIYILELYKHQILKIKMDRALDD